MKNYSPHPANSWEFVDTLLASSKDDQIRLIASMENGEYKLTENKDADLLLALLNAQKNSSEAPYRPINDDATPIEHYSDLVLSGLNPPPEITLSVALSIRDYFAGADKSLEEILFSHVKYRNQLQSKQREKERIVDICGAVTFDMINRGFYDNRDQVAENELREYKGDILDAAHFNRKVDRWAAEIKRLKK